MTRKSNAIKLSKKGWVKPLKYDKIYRKVEPKIIITF